MSPKVDLAAKVSQKVKHNRVLGGVIAALVVITGIFMLLKPIAAGIALMSVASVGFVFAGIFYIYKYLKTPSELKNGWVLANGIITIILGIMLIFSNRLFKVETFSCMFAVIALMTGINQCMAYSPTKKSGAGWMLTQGILNILVAIFFITSPFFMTLAYEWISGIYLIFLGIIIFADTFTA